MTKQAGNRQLEWTPSRSDSWWFEIRKQRNEDDQATMARVCRKLVSIVSPSFGMTSAIIFEEYPEALRLTELPAGIGETLKVLDPVLASMNTDEISGKIRLQIYTADREPSPVDIYLKFSIFRGEDPEVVNTYLTTEGGIYAPPDSTKARELKQYSVNGPRLPPFLRAFICETGATFAPDEPASSPEGLRRFEEPYDPDGSRLRVYPVAVDEGVLRDRISSGWVDVERQTHQLLAQDPTVDFVLNRALEVYYEGVCSGWALANFSALTKIRREITAITESGLDTYSAYEIDAVSDYETLSIVGIGKNLDALVRYANVLHQQPKSPVDSNDPHAYRHSLRQALTALILGNDEQARRATREFHNELNHPRTSPLTKLTGIAHAIEAAATGNQPALNDAVAHALQNHTNQINQTTNAADIDPKLLLHPLLTLICRVAVWRKTMTWPMTPYLLAIYDPLPYPE